MTSMPAKVCLVGPKGAGKSTVASKFDNAAFSKLLNGSVLVNWNLIIGNYEVELQIWDTCGEDRFLCMGPILYKSASAAVCIFDITSSQSFQDLQAWVTGVQRSAMDECILVLLGNKKDMESSRKVSQTEAMKYAESVGATYFEISASTGEGVNDVFSYIALRVLRLQDCYNSYHAKLAITSSGMGASGGNKEKSRHSKVWGGKHTRCFPCFHLR